MFRFLVYWKDAKAGIWVGEGRRMLNDLQVLEKLVELFKYDDR